MMKENNIPRFLINGVILARRPRILKTKPLLYSQKSREMFFIRKLSCGYILIAGNFGYEYGDSTIGSTASKTAEKPCQQNMNERISEINQ